MQSKHVHMHIMFSMLAKILPPNLILTKTNHFLTPYLILTLTIHKKLRFVIKMAFSKITYPVLWFCRPVNQDVRMLH